MITCPRCSLEKEPDARNPHLCSDCVKVENSRSSYMRQHQEDWMAIAQDSGLDPWVQQPGETQWEYSVWCAYRDSYPGKKPSYSQVAKDLNTTYEAVRKIAGRWTFNARMQAWMAECDRITLAQRREEILGMNKQHVDMAARLRDKLSVAIDSIDPYTLKASEVATLMKLSTELERKARLDTVEQEQLVAIEAGSSSMENPDLKKSPTKQADLAEVVKILAAAGALGDLSGIGIRTTSEISLVDKEGRRVVVEDER